MSSLVTRKRSKAIRRRISQKAVLVIFVCLFFLASQVWQEELTGKVVNIADGDTLTLLTEEKQQIKIRLAEIDTPEKGQPFGHASRQILSSLIAGRDIRVIVQDTDRYGRTVGRVYVGDLDVNAAMVERGAAWVYRDYAHNPVLYYLEFKAREQKRGLWSLHESQRQPPWEWRKQQREAKKEKSSF